MEHDATAVNGMNASPSVHGSQRRYNGEEHKYTSPRNSHYGKNKGTYYGGVPVNNMTHHQSPYAPHMNRYYTPHIGMQPPLPPLPPGAIPQSPSPSSTSTDTAGASPQPTHPDNLRCHRCHEKGHYATTCPNKPRMHNGYNKPPRICKFWASGHCQRGDDCTFVHGNPDPNMMYGMPMSPMQMPMPPQQYMIDPVTGTYYYPPMPTMATGYPSAPAYEQASSKTPPPVGAEGDMYDVNYPNEMYTENPYPSAPVYHPYAPQYVSYGQPQGYPGQPNQNRPYYQQPHKMYPPQGNYYPYYSRGYTAPHSAPPTPHIEAEAPHDAEEPTPTEAEPIAQDTPLNQSKNRLRNDTGENNCFLNVVVQVLYHLKPFQDAIAPIGPHDCKGESHCVLCALKTVFALLAPSSNPDEHVTTDVLRSVLSTVSKVHHPTNEGASRFSLGSMDDAAEAHDTLLWQLHKILQTSSTTHDCVCAIHKVFGLLVGEEALCLKCHTKMPTPTYDAMSISVATAQLQDHILYATTNLTTIAYHNCRKKKANKFDKLLGRVVSAGGSARKCSNNRCRNTDLLPSSLKLKQIPRIFSVSLGWPNAQPSSAYLRNIVNSIERKIDITSVFPNVISDGLVAPSVGGQEAVLMAMFCYFGHHYMAFIFKRATQEWLSFEDTVVTRVGNEWSDVQKVCLEKHFQPMMLFYEVDRKEKVLQFTIGDIVMSVATEIDQENWRSSDAEDHLNS
ncbi:inactive ubiquitin carboxyl-terminal hydrolase 54-like [Thraustotheca clavata]|uniref:Inactive ubiquitin carboxyl-terminal hydrolase 54-like n=1 Tax=Thraustotheca clavata TaxID=74557 RepID=A0A1V9Y8F9_9STRA|nr:inactive ubiquitin carboxyl-terminal hydrolase 54-like [Thraustotheca clavata]